MSYPDGAEQVRTLSAFLESFVKCLLECPILLPCIHQSLFCETHSKPGYIPLQSCAPSQTQSEPCSSSQKMLRRLVQNSVARSRASLITQTSRGLSSTTRPATTVIEEEGASTHPLYYHLIPGPNPVSLHDSFAISFLKTPPITPESRTIIGFLPSQGEEPGLADFKENSKRSQRSLACCQQLTFPQ